MASLHNFSDMKAEFMGQASQKEKQAESTPENGPLQNTGSSTGAGNQETPSANASTCILVIIGTGASWVKVSELLLALASVEKASVLDMSSKRWFCWHANAE